MADKNRLNVRLSARTDEQVNQLAGLYSDTQKAITTIAIDRLWTEEHRLLHHKVVRKAITECPWCGYSGATGDPSLAPS